MPTNESHFLNNTETQQRIDTRTIDTLIGLCTGIVADGEINNQEISFLKTWVNDNKSVTTKWPGNAIAKQLEFIVQDEENTSNFKEDLLALLLVITGCNFISTGAASPDQPALPIEFNPCIAFKNKRFCFTGKFLTGTRKSCVNQIESLGGIHLDDITPKTDYLVIGAIINPSWAHTTFGRKIEGAVLVKKKHGLLQIISEEQWLDALNKA